MSAARLPFCPYPSSADTARHGLQPLPETLPLWTPDRAIPHRSPHRRLLPATQLTLSQLDQLAAVVGASFAQRDTMMRHLQLPADFPWTKAGVFKNLVNLFFLTGPDGQPRPDVLAQSVAMVDDNGAILGGAINETLPHEPAPDTPLDPVRQATAEVFQPILDYLGELEHAAVIALADRFPDFRHALEIHRVGHHALVARGDAIPTEDAFELVAGSAMHYQSLGFTHILTAAVNPWTGAAFSALGGIPVYFGPFGPLSAKPSGTMIYLLRLG